MYIKKFTNFKNKIKFVYTTSYYIIFTSHIIMCIIIYNIRFIYNHNLYTTQYIKVIL